MLFANAEIAAVEIGLQEVAYQSSGIPVLAGFAFIGASASGLSGGSIQLSALSAAGSGVSSPKAQAIAPSVLSVAGIGTAAYTAGTKIVSGMNATGSGTFSPVGGYKRAAAFTFTGLGNASFEVVNESGFDIFCGSSVSFPTAAFANVVLTSENSSTFSGTGGAKALSSVTVLGESSLSLLTQSVTYGQLYSQSIAAMSARGHKVAASSVSSSNTGTAVFTGLSYATSNVQAYGYGSSVFAVQFKEAKSTAMNASGVGSLQFNGVSVNLGSVTASGTSTFNPIGSAPSHSTMNSQSTASVEIHPGSPIYLQLPVSNIRVQRPAEIRVCIRPEEVRTTTRAAT